MVDLDQAAKAAVDARQTAFKRMKYIRSQTNDPNEIAKAKNDLETSQTTMQSAVAAARAAKKKPPAGS